MSGESTNRLHFGTCLILRRCEGGMKLSFRCGNMWNYCAMHFAGGTFAGGAVIENHCDVFFNCFPPGHDILHGRYRVRCNPSQSLSQTFVQMKISMCYGRNMGCNNVIPCAHNKNSRHGMDHPSELSSQFPAISPEVRIPGVTATCL